MQLDVLEVRMSPPLAARMRERTMDLNDRMQALRRQFAQDFGFVLPTVKVREAGAANDWMYQVMLHGNRIGQGELHPDQVLAINPGGQRARLEGKEARDPAYGLPAQWIAPEARQFARGAGYTLVEPDTVLLTHMSELLKRHAAELLSRAEVERLALRLKAAQPGLVDELIPGILTYADVQKVLQALLRELVSIRQVDAIFEVLVDAGRHSKNADELAERVRERLGPSICQKASNDAGELHVLTLAPDLERAMLQAVRQREAALPLLNEAGQVDGFISNLARQADAMLAKSLMPVLLCPGVLRRQVRGLIQRSLPHVAVIGVNELPANAIVRSFGSVAPHIAQVSA